MRKPHYLYSAGVTRPSLLTDPLHGGATSQCSTEFGALPAPTGQPPARQGRPFRLRPGPVVWSPGDQTSQEAVPGAGIPAETGRTTPK